MLAACGGDPAPTQAGSDPQLPDRERGLLPAMGIANPTPWGNQRPVVPQDYTISAIATDLKIPRQTIGRASSRARVCQYVYISVVSVSFKKTRNTSPDQD